MTEGLIGPEHSDTFPPESSGADQVARVDSAEKTFPAPSTHSNEPINVSGQVGPDEDQMGMPRKRKTFMSGFGGKSVDEETDSNSPKDVPDKPKFTAMGQIKATIFNSWINVLLFAAPVGSKCESMP
jgi:Ca2+:H+ antiporter